MLDLTFHGAYPRLTVLPLTFLLPTPPPPPCPSLSTLPKIISSFPKNLSLFLCDIATNIWPIMKIVITSPATGPGFSYHLARCLTSLSMERTLDSPYYHSRFYSLLLPLPLVPPSPLFPKSLALSQKISPFSLQYLVRCYTCYSVRPSPTPPFSSISFVLCYTRYSPWALLVRG